MILYDLWDLETEDVTGFARAIADAQRFMRQELASESAVSQRDIIRVIRLLATRHRRVCSNSTIRL